MALNLSTGSDDFRSSQQQTGSSYSTRNHQQHGEKLTIDFQTLQRWCQSGVEWSAKTFRNRVRLETLRPLTMFMGITTKNHHHNNNNPASFICYLSPESFSPPVKHLDKSTLEKVKSRLSINFAFFLTNYVLVTLVVATVVSLMHPSMLVFVAILYGLWAGHHAWGDYQVQMFGLDLDRFLSKSIRARALLIITTIVVIGKCLWPLINAAILSALIVLSHAFLRDPKHIELSDDGGFAGDGKQDEEDETEGGLYGHGDISEAAVLVERPSSNSGRSTARNVGGRGDII